MKPPTISELRRMAEACTAMNDAPNSSDYRHDRIVAMALERWAVQLERKAEHISHYLRKKKEKET